jgi:hypothetical protein
MTNVTTPSQKKLEKGVGYETIYSSNREKIEISANYTVLRRTIGRYEHIYLKESNLAKIREIQYQSTNWNKLKGAFAYSSTKYYVEFQLNAASEETGNIRIAVRSSIDVVKYVYYVRRKSNAI